MGQAPSSPEQLAASRIQLSGARQEEVNGIWYPYPEFTPSERMQSMFNYNSRDTRWPARWQKDIEGGVGRDLGREPDKQSTLSLEVYEEFCEWCIAIDGETRYSGVIDYSSNDEMKHLAAKYVDAPGGQKLNMGASDEARYAHKHLPNAVNKFGKGKLAGSDPHGWYSRADLYTPPKTLSATPDRGPIVTFLDANPP